MPLRHIQARRITAYRQSLRNIRCCFQAAQLISDLREHDMKQSLEFLFRILLFRRNHLPAFCPPSVESINGKDADKNHIAERLKANKRAVALYGTPHRRSALSTPVATVVGKGTHPRCSKDHGRRRCDSGS